MLIADRDLMITVNSAAAQIYERACDAVDYGTFSRPDFVEHLLRHYDLSRHDAEMQMRSLLGFALRHRMVLKNRTA